MPVRPVVAGAALLVILAACGGGPAATGSGATAPVGSTAIPPPATGPAATGSAGTGAAIDLSQVDACALVDVSLIEALTGETGFATDDSSSPASSTCFWGVTRPGVPQYLEVQITRRTASLEGYGITFNGIACPGAAVPGVGVEAVGAVCSGVQQKVWLAAMGRGVMVQVLVNEPKGALNPADLAAAVNGVIAGLG